MYFSCRNNQKANVVLPVVDCVLNVFAQLFTTAVSLPIHVVGVKERKRKLRTLTSVNVRVRGVNLMSPLWTNVLPDKCLAKDSNRNLRCLLCSTDKAGKGIKVTCRLLWFHCNDLSNSFICVCTQNLQFCPLMICQIHGQSKV